MQDEQGPSEVAHQGPGLSHRRKAGPQGQRNERAGDRREPPKDRIRLIVYGSKDGGPNGNVRPSPFASRPRRSAALRDRGVLALGVADVDLARAVDLLLRGLGDFLPVRDPAGHAADGEDDGDDRRIWAGILPLRVVAGEAYASEMTPEGTPVSPSVIAQTQRLV